MTHLTIDISFRFCQLNKMQALTLSREIDGVSYTANPDTEATVGGQTKPGSYSALVPLKSENLEAITMFYVRQGMEVSNCDILVCITGVKAAGFTLPAIVNQMLKHVDCPLSFSLLN